MPLLLLTRGEVLGIAVTVFVLLAVVFAWLKHPGLIAALTTKTNWGPDWDCQYVPKGESICIKRVPNRG